MKTKFIQTSKQDFIDDLRLEHLKWKSNIVRQGQSLKRKNFIAEFSLKEIND